MTNHNAKLVLGEGFQTKPLFPITQEGPKRRQTPCENGVLGWFWGVFGGSQNGLLRGWNSTVRVKKESTQAFSYPAATNYNITLTIGEG